jgi:hypothetical protein
MRALLMACLLTLVLGAGWYFVLDALQQPSGVAFATDGARIDLGWDWRTVSVPSSAQQCQPRRIWQWFFVDMRNPEGEPSVCSDSQ